MRNISLARSRAQTDELLTQLGVSRPRLTIPDLVLDAVGEILTRPARTLLTLLGTILGVGALVATIGIAQTAGHQVSSRFDALRATQVSAVDVRPDDPTPAFPPDTDEILAGLNGVVSGGEVWMAADQVTVRSVPAVNANETSKALPVLAATPGGLKAMDLQLQEGRLFDSFHYTRGEQVAVVGEAAARRLNLARVADQPAVFIDDMAYSVIGVVASSARRPDATLSVIIPGTAISTLESSGNAHELLVEVVPGAAQMIGRQLPFALSPADPERFLVTAPPDPQSLRADIESDLDALFLVLAGLGLIMGVVGIANTSLLSVMERTSEYGLRRAMGARPGHILSHVLTEAATLGTAGGLVGMTLGVLALTGVAAVNTWTAVLNPIVLLVAPAVGTLTGLLAGAYPAFRATRIEPVEALRR